MPRKKKKPKLSFDEFKRRTFPIDCLINGFHYKAYLYRHDPDSPDYPIWMLTYHGNFKRYERFNIHAVYKAYLNDEVFMWHDE